MKRIIAMLAVALAAGTVALAAPAGAAAGHAAHLSTAYAPQLCLTSGAAGSFTSDATCAWSRTAENWQASSGPAIENAAGRCLANVHGTTRVEPCDGSLGQQWTITPADGHVESRSEPGWCLSWAPSPGSVAPCITGRVQVWQWTTRV